MTNQQINDLLLNGTFPGSQGRPELVETHISWVFLCENLVYKIKKPIHYPFLDFSTKEKRKYYCDREVILNQRLTHDLYLDVQAVRQTAVSISMGGEQGEVIDYAVRMKKLDKNRQMDILLLQNKVTDSDIRQLAEKIANFHKHAKIIYNKDLFDIRNKFKDLELEKVYLGEHLSLESSILISKAIEISDKFTHDNKDLLGARLKGGFFRDGHGDLHSRNIFLLPLPQPFDCIEFNDDYRQTDILNDVAFLCMDLDAFGRRDLSNSFITYYNSLFPSMITNDDRQLFIYYKSYRSNIRAKVNSLRARTAENEIQVKDALAEANKYLHLMMAYLQEIEQW